MSAHEDKLNGSLFVHCIIPFVLANKVRKINLYSGAFLFFFF